MTRLVTYVTLMLAIAVRLAAVRGDLEIDEVWSWLFVQNNVQDAADVFRIRHDNNHILNTLVMYACGPQADGWWYRLPAALASVATVWLAGQAAARTAGEPGRAFAVLLCGGSYLLILYGSEARGYSYALCCAVLCWELLQRIAATHRQSDALGFAVAACLGLLAHLTFVYALAGFAAWWLTGIVCRSRAATTPAEANARRDVATGSERRHVGIWLTAGGPPLLLAAWLYFGFLQGMGIGGGPEIPLWGALVTALSISFGGPLAGDGALATAALAAVVLAVALWRRCRHDLPETALLGVTIVLTPAAVLALTGHPLVYPRYFFIPVGFGLIAAAGVLAEMWRRARGMRLLAFALTAAYLIGNGGWVVRLLDHGRGDYSRAIARMASQSEGTFTVSSDHDFRNGLMLLYYVPRAADASLRLHYLTQPQIPPQGTDWAILHDFYGDDPYPNDFTDRFGNRYQLDRVFPHQSLAGFNWWLYRKSAAP